MRTSPTQRERMLATQVRELSLNLIYRYLNDESEDNAKFRKDLLLKLATNILPRKNEITGEDGSPIKVIVPKEVAEAFNINETITETSGSNQEQEQV